MHLHQGLALFAVFAPLGKRRGKARGDLRVERIELEDMVGEEGVASAVSGMETGRIGAGEGADKIGRASCWERVFRAV